MRLLWVVPRFGKSTVGGAETLVGALSAKALPPGWTAEVATTCAVDHYSWKNALPPGEHVDGGILVRRFPVGERDARRYEELHAAVLAGAAGYADELEWLANSVWSPELQHFLAESAAAYDLMLFSPYMFGTTIWGAQVSPERSALVPCLHDEPYAYLPTIRALVRSVRGCIFNTASEQALATRIYGPVSGEVVGMGFHDPDGAPTTSFAGPRELGPYVLYAGRIEEAKRVDVAVEYASRYFEERERAPRLVLVGHGTYRPPRSASKAVSNVGFVDEEEKRGAYAEAVALVNPSYLESLSIVLMEAWLEQTPALVATGSPVLRSHVEQSGGGLLFDSYEEYRDALDALTGDEALRARLGEAGRRYVLTEYGWPAVRERFRRAVEELAA
jgi:glycosyltransferase involved in cell wall biosynthesis